MTPVEEWGSCVLQPSALMAGGSRAEPTQLITPVVGEGLNPRTDSDCWARRQLLALQGRSTEQSVPGTRFSETQRCSEDAHKAGLGRDCQARHPFGTPPSLQAQVTRLEISLPIRGSTWCAQEKPKSGSAFFPRKPTEGGEGGTNMHGRQATDSSLGLRVKRAPLRLQNQSCLPRSVPEGYR